MEMCYDGALVMPSNFVAVSEEEMTYIDGGMTKTDMVISALISLVMGVASSKVANWLTIARMKSALSFCASAWRIVCGAVSSAISFVLNTPVLLASIAFAVGAAAGAAYAYYKYTH